MRSVVFSATAEVVGDDVRKAGLVGSSRQLADAAGSSSMAPITGAQRLGRAPPRRTHAHPPRLSQRSAGRVKWHSLLLHLCRVLSRLSTSSSPLGIAQPPRNYHIPPPKKVWRDTILTDTVVLPLSCLQIIIMPYNTTAIPPRREPTGQTQLPCELITQPCSAQLF